MARMRWQLLRRLNVGLILVTFVAYLSPYVAPDGWFWWVQFFGMAFPYLLIAHVLFVLTWLYRRSAYALMSVACIVLGWGHVTTHIGFSFSDADIPAEADTITVYTYNYRGVRTRQGADDQQISLRSVAGHMASRGVDIACFQEHGLNPITHQQALAALQEATGVTYHIHTQPDNRLVTFSKYPIVGSGIVDRLYKANGIVYVDVAIGKRTLRVYNTHLLSSGISTETQRLTGDRDVPIAEGQRWNTVKELFRRVTRSGRSRVRQARALAEHIAACPHPVVVCGDFNETPLSHAYYLLDKRLEDSFQERGSGLGTTYIGLPPMLRIDYILHSPVLTTVDHTITDPGLSDHYANIAELAWVAP